MPLDQWQLRLEKHFCKLAASHAATGVPLFALEHDLNKGEFDIVTQFLHERLGAGQPLDKHWLVWVIYATELGYDYDGEEYWHSFEEQTPQWKENVDRRKLRFWFAKFQKAFGGYKPSGPWAESFTIICWPITYAILPKFLQFQFAETLYNLRYRLAGLVSMNPTDVGRVLAANAWGVSSRFRTFLEQEELCGRLVLGLLGRKSPDTQSPIYKPTLERILADLERVQKAREWMTETRRVVDDRFAGTARRLGTLIDPRDHFGGEPTDRSPESQDIGIRPTLLVRPSGSDLWSVMLEMPDFNGIASLNPEFRNFLRTTRCKVAGAGDTWSPSGWLLYGRQKRVLKTWPDPTRAVIQFEQPNKAVQHLLDSECVLTQGSIWLCRLGPDRIAREISGRIVRPGREYIVLSRAPFTPAQTLIAPCQVDCSGISAGFLAMPEKLSAEEIAALQKLGLQVAQTIRIWPSGLVGRGWDGEGNSEWLTTESPCFGIVHDHPVDSYLLSLDNGSTLSVDAGTVGFPAFVKLAPLPAGFHILSARAQRTDTSSAPMANLEGFIALRVREPEPWIPGTTLHSGLVVLLDPPYPTLDSFWEGAVAISILGPEGHHIACSISLRNAGGEELESFQIGRFDLPVNPRSWSKVCSKIVQDQNRAWSYLRAASARLLIRGHELGEFIVRLERDVSPVRWICRHDHRATEVRLIDDTGLDDPPTAQFYSFAQPTAATQLAPDAARHGLTAEASGGLYVGYHGQHRDALVVGTPLASGGLAGLVTIPNLNSLEIDSVSPVAIVRWLELWSDARLAGPLARIRRIHVTKAISHRLYARLCGTHWGKAESAFLENTASESALQFLSRSVGGLPGFAAALRHNHGKMEAGTELGGKWFADVAARYSVCPDFDLCDFAMRVSSQPHRLQSAFGEKLDALFQRLSGNGVLLRGARLVALLAAVQEAGEAGPGMPRWQWS